MNLNKGFILIAVAVLLTQCAVKQFKGSEEDILYRRLHPLASCDEYFKDFDKLSSCNKIYFLKRNKHFLLYSCIRQLDSAMYPKTDISPSISAGTIGLYYPSDTLWDYDLKRWAKALGCTTYDPKQAFQSPCDKVFEGFDQMSNCEKVQFVKTNKAIIYPDCVWELHMNMISGTGYGAFLSIGEEEGYKYEVDTLFDYDIKRWNRLLDCSE